MQFATLSSPHGDVVHDISFDYYGNRFASCSSDRCIKVWDLDANGTWSSCDIPRAHQDCIWRLSWAHPEFGQLLASCSEDKSVNIWEEQEVVNSGDGEAKGKWQKKVQLSDSKKSVNDVKFSPRYLGLKLATASADGMVRIYEASDVFSLNYWPMQVRYVRYWTDLIGISYQ
jgi:nucleoporin SEH1